MALIIYPHSEPLLKKEQSYTSTPLRAFIACSRVNFTFLLQEFSLPSVKLRALISSQLSCICVVESNSNNLVKWVYPSPTYFARYITNQFVNSSLKLPAQPSNNTLLLVHPPHLSHKTSILYYKMHHLTSPTFPFCCNISCIPGNPWHFLTESSVHPITHSPYFDPIYQVNSHIISYIYIFFFFSLKF